MRYLIVDNAAPVRLALARCVREAEHVADIREASRGAEALEICAAWRPHVVFTGMGLADGERGLPFVKALLDRDATAIVILCTSMPKAHMEVAEALSAGAFAYLAKPVRGEAVQHVLNELAIERGAVRRIR